MRQFTEPHRYRGITIRRAVTQATMPPSNAPHPCGYNDELREFEENHYDDAISSDYREEEL